VALAKAGARHSPKHEGDGGLLSIERAVACAELRLASPSIHITGCHSGTNKGGCPSDKFCSTSKDKQMKYVYILQSLSHPDQYYTGSTEDFKERLKVHNAGKVPHTAKFLPWKPIVVLTFSDDQCALQFERYLKSGSGRAFSNTHFR
ncbi:MAG: GIY-YIG nuclease family protein, partial [Armatimonadota bacterium]